MRLELAERIRCPNPHAPTPMIVVAREKRDREIVRGFAGCPVCHLEARIDEGHLRFHASSGERTAPRAPSIEDSGWTPALDRTIALLGLAEPGGAVLLTGRYAAHAEALAASCDVAVLVMGASSLPAASDLVAGLTGELSVMPFTDGTFRAAAVDLGATDLLTTDVARTVAVGGRMLAPITLLAPAGLKELARDDHEWVAAREAVGSIVELSRRK